MGTKTCINCGSDKLVQSKEDGNHYCARCGMGMTFKETKEEK